MKSFRGLLPSNFIKGSVAKLRINLSKSYTQSGLLYLFYAQGNPFAINIPFFCISVHFFYL